MKSVRKIMIFLGSLFTFIGLITLGLGVWLYINTQSFKENAKQTEARIIDIQSEYRNEDIDYNVYVTFNVDGKIYYGELNYYTSSMNIGDQVKIYYDPDNPNNFRSNNFEIGIIIAGIIGFAFTAIGLIFLIINIRKSMVQKRVIKYNYLIEADIKNVELKSNISINGRHPYILIATAISPKNGMLHIFESEYFFEDIKYNLQANNIRKVLVYVNPNNYDKYYVNIDTLKSNYGIK